MTELNVRFTGFSRIDFDRAPIRKALRSEGNLIRNAARNLVSGSGVSAPGEFPGRSSGVLKSAIRTKMLRGGFAVAVRPEKTARMGKDFYPVFLLHGVKKRRGKVLNPGLKPRADYMIEGLAFRRVAAVDAIQRSLKLSLVPRS